MHQPRACGHSTDPDDYPKQEYPWTLAQIADPRAETYLCNFSLRQLAVVADGLSRRPCSFASPPFGGFAFSSSFSSSCLVRCKAPVRSYYAATALETILPQYRPCLGLELRASQQLGRNSASYPILFAETRRSHAPAITSSRASCYPDPKARSVTIGSFACDWHSRPRKARGSIRGVCRDPPHCANN